VTGRLAAAVPPSLLVLGLLGGCGEDSGDVSGAAEEPSSSAASSSPPAAPTPSITTEPAEPPSTDAGGRRVVVYYVGDGPRGPVLFPEAWTVGEPDHGPAEHLGLLSATPRDPDYRTAWPSGFFRNGGRVNVDDGTIDVNLADPSLTDRPPSMSRAEAQASIQQVVYTLQKYAGLALPLRFLIDGQPAGRLLGVDTAEPVAASPVLETLSLMSLTTPEEGQVVSGSFRASGFNNGFEGTAAWQVLDASGQVVADGATIGGWTENRLFPWHDRVDVSRLAPGTYTFLASNDDPTGGTEGFGPDTDTRSIVVQ